MASSKSMEITSVESSSHTLITTHKLNGINYIQWSQSVRMFICGKGKDEFLSSQNEQPKIIDLEFKKWKVDNMVMSWLINSMTNEIGENFLLYETAHRFWDVVKETFSSKENALELSRIESVFAKVITQYFNNLSRHCQRLDLFEFYTWKGSSDATEYKEILEKKRTFKFLLCLNNDLDEVRERIMGIKPLPSLRETFSEVWREESRKS